MLTFPSPLIFTQRSPASHPPQLVLALTADERTKSRHYFQAQVLGPQHPNSEQGVYLQLPRGTVLRHDDYITTATQDVGLKVIAKPEPVMTVTTSQPLALLKAAYHLGNRHVSLEVCTTYLRFSPDPVLKQMLEQMGLTVTSDLAPFQPESGAYGRTMSHSHTSADHGHTS